LALVDRLGKSLESAPVLLSSVDALVDWSLGHSLWAMPMGTACCAMELIAASFSKFDFDRHGTFPRPDPRHVDVMIVAGTVTRKMQPAVKRLYDQMPDPKWVIAMGECAISGGIFFHDSYSVVRGVDEFLPVDVYIAGCPPRPESLQDGVLRLRELVATRSIGPDTHHPGKLLLPQPTDVRRGTTAPADDDPATVAEAPDDTSEGGDAA
jgi:NADH-quinone oxidoreductase B subunit